ncbi:MAG: hypothetical protein M1825_003179 [Sarcosagium campestre]|nr:MAG: hypothetical protein M1825_003179 [Sarcosagium campestre]
MATIVARPQHLAQSQTPPPFASALTLNTSRAGPVPVPNKHLQPLSPGSPPTPPKSPPTRCLSIQTSSILYPPETFPPLIDSPRVYSLDGDSFAAALDHIASQPLPEPKQVFPWLHGLHSDNQVQVAYFVARRRALMKTPTCIRGITVVKLGGDLTRARIKGAISPDELLSSLNEPEPTFLDVDPRQGFSVRNFQIQVAKLAQLSDIVVYGDQDAKEEDLHELARQVSRAQRRWRLDNDISDEESLFHTFILRCPFLELERLYPELIAVDSQSQFTGKVVDFFQCERIEMCTMSRASEIAPNVFLGPTPDQNINWGETSRPEEYPFDLFIEASDLASVPDQRALTQLSEKLEKTDEPQTLEFPSSGSVVPQNWSTQEVEETINTCRWMKSLADPIDDNETTPNDDDREIPADKDGDIEMTSTSKQSSPRRRRKILIHCADGYTESSLLALTYFMFVEGVPVDEAWLRLHCEKQRNFFAYPSDVSLLSGLQQRLLSHSPKVRGVTPTSSAPWLARMDGSLPSRILDYMYLGNLAHANNPDLLRAMGIRQVLSVGEALSWSEEEQKRWGYGNLLLVDQVQDNGVDPLTEEFHPCLDFISRGKMLGTATLVHCRVGVSRSATICIAEVMRTKKLSLPRAYCFVRARRLNVIIQPHLRFSYELLKWEETQQSRRREPLRRELEWASIAREIALMNRPYSR